MTHSAASDSFAKASSPNIESEARFLGVGGEKACEANVMRSAEW